MRLIYAFSYLVISLLFGFYFGFYVSTVFYYLILAPVLVFGFIYSPPALFLSKIYQTIK